MLATSAAGAQRAAEMDRLAELLRIAPGMSVAEIGAGRGRETVDMAERIGPTGRMFSTEIDPARLEDIRRAVREAGLDNVTVVEGEATATGLPEACCDAIYMRTVYHHFTHPTAMLDSLRAALRPGGLLAVIDFAPRSASARPSGTPGRRGGHGISSAQLAAELRQAGFEVLEEVDSWSGRNFLVLARRP